MSLVLGGVDRKPEHVLKHRGSSEMIIAGPWLVVVVVAEIKGPTKSHASDILFRESCVF